MVVIVVEQEVKDGAGATGIASPTAATAVGGAAAGASVAGRGDTVNVVTVTLEEPAPNASGLVPFGGENGPPVGITKPPPVPPVPW